jgi:hypothetical protein
MSLLLLFQPAATGLIAQSFSASMGSWAGATREVVGKQLAGQMGSWSATVTFGGAVYVVDFAAPAMGAWAGATSRDVGRPVAASTATWSATGRAVTGKSAVAAMGVWSAVTGEVVGKSLEAAGGAFSGAARSASAKRLLAAAGTFVGSVARATEQQSAASMHGWSVVIASSLPSVSFSGTAGRRFDVPGEMRITTVAYDARIIEVGAEQRIYAARKIG